MMNKEVIVIGIIILNTILGLIGCIRFTTGIMITKLDNEPNIFINMAEDQMKIFPNIKEAILINKIVEVSSPSEEITQLKGILWYVIIKIIKYQNEYYKKTIFYAD